MRSLNIDITHYCACHEGQDKKEESLLSECQAHDNEGDLNREKLSSHVDSQSKE